MRVLVACEFSGTVRDAFIAKGHDAWSCDILPTEKPGPHIFGDVLEILDAEWDMMIGHPPCTYLTNAGVRHLHIGVTSRNGNHAKVFGPERWIAMEEGAKFFMALKNAPIPRICLENPVPHGYARKIIGRYQQKIQPYEFNEPFTKATCLWLKGLPPLMASVICQERTALCHKCPPGPDRWKIRSRTYPGIAKAMADQWGTL